MKARTRFVTEYEAIAHSDKCAGKFNFPLYFYLRVIHEVIRTLKIIGPTNIIITYFDNYQNVC